MSVRILVIIFSRFFLTSARHEYIEAVVSKENTRSRGEPAAVTGGAAFLVSECATPGVGKLPNFFGDPTPAIDKYL